MITPFVLYQERFKPGMPSQICKLVSDYLAWDEADPLLLAAIRSGEPIKDWPAFIEAIWAVVQNRPDDYMDKLIAEEMKRFGR